MQAVGAIAVAVALAAAAGADPVHAYVRMRRAGASLVHVTACMTRQKHCSFLAVAHHMDFGHVAHTGTCVRSALSVHRSWG